MLESDLTEAAKTPTDLKCCLLISEALAKASQGASGGGPSTALHWLLDLSERWLKEGNAFLSECRDALDSQIAASLGRVCANLPLLIAEARREQPAAGDGDSHRGDNEIFKQARDQAYYLDRDLEPKLKTKPDFIAFANSPKKWPILGFHDEADYKDFLFPSIQALARDPGPMQRDLLKRLIGQSKFSPRQLKEEGYREALVMDTVNALLTVEWAEWTDLNELGSRAKGTVTPVGKRLLKQLVATVGASAVLRKSPEQSDARPQDLLSSKKTLAIWREKLAFLLQEQAVVSDSAQKFSLEKEIEKTRSKIRELENAP